MRQKPHVRFLEAFPVPAVGSVSRPADRISDTAQIGAELKPHGGEQSFDSASGCGRLCRMTQGGLTRSASDSQDEERSRTGHPVRLPDSTPNLLSAGGLPSADFPHLTG